jgi:two-component system chemotaxis sensor kinase CheA
MTSYDRSLLLPIFLEEALEHLATLEHDLVELEKSVENADSELINSIFRAIHSIKGNAPMVGLKNVSNLSHAMETCFAQVRDKIITIDMPLVNAIYESFDMLSQMIADIDTSDDLDISAFVEKLNTFINQSPTPKKEKKSLIKDTAPTGDDISVEKDLESPIPATDTAPATHIEHAVHDTKTHDHTSTHTQRAETVRVSVKLLNDIMTEASELVLARNQLLRSSQSSTEKELGLSEVVQKIDKITSILQEKILHTRLQPISIIFEKLPRLIRELEHKLDKNIRLFMSGNDVMLDKSIIENLSDPLTHIVRNCADHGIETSEVRESAGKPEYGTISISASGKGGKIYITVSDDGGGFHRDKILDAALKKNILTAESAEKMTDSQIYELTLAPGFSTATSVTTVSGRGVGMDVVKTNIEKLGGRISIESSPYDGSTVTLIMPLTLAIMPALIFRVGEINFAIPQATVHEVVRVKRDDGDRRIEHINDRLVLRLPDKLIPVVTLHDILSISHTSTDHAVTRLLVLHHNNNKFAIIVDEIFTNQEVVIKSLPKFFRDCGIYSGTTIMGDGSVALIVDTLGIALRSNLDFVSLAEQNKMILELYESNITHHLLHQILIFSNSDSDYFAICLDQLQKVEMFNCESIKIIDGKEYYVFEDTDIQIVRLEKFLPVSPTNITDENIFVLISNHHENPIGIIAHSIVDVREMEDNINHDFFTVRGLLGTSVIDDLYVLFPDVYELHQMHLPEKTSHDIHETNHHYHILAVEDSPFFRVLEKNYIHSVGYNVDIACDGVEALAMLSSKHYDLLISDILMPEMDGYELVRRVRSMPEIMHIPCIALTTLASHDSRQTAFFAGFDSYLIKFDKGRVLSEIDKLIKSNPEKKVDHTDVS